MIKFPQLKETQNITIKNGHKQNDGPLSSKCYPDYKFNRWNCIILDDLNKDFNILIDHYFIELGSDEEEHFIKISQYESVTEQIFEMRSFKGDHFKTLEYKEYYKAAFPIKKIKTITYENFPNPQKEKE